MKHLSIIACAILFSCKTHEQILAANLEATRARHQQELADGTYEPATRRLEKLDALILGSTVLPVKPFEVELQKLQSLRAKYLELHRQEAVSQLGEMASDYLANSYIHSEAYAQTLARIDNATLDLQASYKEFEEARNTHEKRVSELEALNISANLGDHATLSLQSFEELQVTFQVHNNTKGKLLYLKTYDGHEVEDSDGTMSFVMTPLSGLSLSDSNNNRLYINRVKPKTIGRSVSIRPGQHARLSISLRALPVGENLIVTIPGQIVGAPGVAKISIPSNLHTRRPEGFGY
ncbi:MAG: hypothetical protein ACYS26_00845 [Planctomycetota bacterium]|jgi:hypothetical protein